MPVANSEAIPEITPIGIDLGTTNCAIAVLDRNGRTRLLANDLGDLLTPSAVRFHDQGWQVGREAVHARLFEPESVAVSPKRDLGLPCFRHAIRGRRVPPEVLQACLLREMKQVADRHVGPPYQAVVGVPAFFDDRRRQATCAAAEMAGIPLLDLVAEPIAAALSYAEYHGYLAPTGMPDTHTRLIVVDLGGGTFDVTLLELQPGSIRVLGTDGDVHLGGNDWDRRLVDYMSQKFEGQYRLDPREDPSTLARLEILAKEAREALSARHQVTVPVEFRGARRDLVITQSQFEVLTADLMERTMQTTSELLRTCRCDWNSIGRVLLAGGATRMPALQKRFHELAGQAPDQSINPDEAIARGAAIYAAYRLGQTGERSPRLRARVANIVPHSLGIEGVDPQTGRREHRILIPRNTPIPACVVEPFTTRWDDQGSVVIRILEGESIHPTECAAIGVAILDALPSGLHKGHPMQVVFEVADNDRLQVRLRVSGLDRELVLRLQRETQLPSLTRQRWRAVLEGAGRIPTFDDVLRQVLELQPSDG